MQRDFTRRQFLSGVGIAGSATLLSPLLFKSDAVAAVPCVRRDIGGMTAYDPIIVSYAKAVTAMKALPATNPLSWAYQAAIHGTFTTPVQPAWNTCEHGTYFFWSWHRMYLYWFERIIRKMSGDSCWCLPYWNYSSPTERQLPLMFRDTSSALYVSNRNPAMNDGTGSLPASFVDYSSGFAALNFTSASGSIEGTPHGAVHVGVGGWMGSVPTAAQDPIFYLHHCNIDRLWNLWLAQGGGRSDPLNDSTWAKTKFTFFNENGAQVQMTGCDVLRAAEQLNYVYEGEPVEVNQYCLRIIIKWIFVAEILLKLPIPPVVLTSDRLTLPLEIKSIRDRIISIAKSESETVVVQLQDVVADRQPGVVWEVYLGLPPDAQPDPQSPFFIGNLALFGAGIRSEAKGHEFKSAHFDFPVDRAVLEAIKRSPDNLSLTFIPRGILVNGKPTAPKLESKVQIGHLNFAVEARKQK